MEDSLQQMAGSDMGEQTNTFDQSLNNPVAESSAKQDEHVELQIPVAVYTARFGYAWAGLPESIEISEATDWYNTILLVLDKMHVGLQSGDILKGVLYKGGLAIVFSLQKVAMWDRKMRDANYCACALIPKENLVDIDIGVLLDEDWFNNPRRNPEEYIKYPVKQFDLPSDDELKRLVRKCKECEKDGFSWHHIGPLLGKYGEYNSSWLFAMMYTRDGKSYFDYQLGDWYDADDVRSEEVLRQSPCDDVSQNGIESVDDGTLDINMNNKLNELERKIEKANRIIAEKEREYKAVLKDREQLKQKLKLKVDEVRSVRANLEAERHKKFLSMGSGFLVGIIVAGICFLIIQLCFPTTSNRDVTYEISSKNDEQW